LTTSSDHRTDLIQDVKVLFKKKWPSEINIRYGEESVSNLCELVRLPEKRSYMTAFQEYVDTGISPRDLNPLPQAVKSIQFRLLSVKELLAP
jgi:hypothetical protein